MANVREVDALLLSRQWRDVDDGIEIVLWARSAGGPVRLRVSRQEAVMFVPREATTFAGRRVPRPLSTLDGRPVDAVYFRSQRALVDERQRLREAGETPLESDVKPSDRYVMERFVTGALHIAGPCTERRGVLFFDEPRIRSAEVKVALSVLALDLETDGFGGPLLSAAVATRDCERVFVRGPKPTTWTEDAAGGVSVEFVPDERGLLSRLRDVVERRSTLACHQDPDELVLRRARDAGMSLLRPAAADLDHAPGPRHHRARTNVLRGHRPAGDLRRHRLAVRPRGRFDLRRREGRSRPRSGD